MSKSKFTLGIQRNEQETDFDDHVTYRVYVVSHFGRSDAYTLTSVSDEYVTTEAQAHTVADRVAAKLRTNGADVRVIDLPTVRRLLPEGW